MSTFVDESMSRRRKTQPKRASPGTYVPPVRPPRRRQASAEAIFAAVLVGAIGYVAAEMALASKPHPTHWFVTLLIALIAFGGAEAIYRQKNPF